MSSFHHLPAHVVDEMVRAVAKAYPRSIAVRKVLGALLNHDFYGTRGPYESPAADTGFNEERVRGAISRLRRIGIGVIAGPSGTYLCQSQAIEQAERLRRRAKTILKTASRLARLAQRFSYEKEIT